MAKEPDVARVAAAFNAPGLKYRSFGNMPVRNDAPRSEAASQDPEAVLREIRAAAAVARLAEAEAAAAPVEVEVLPAALEAEEPTITMVPLVTVASEKAVPVEPPQASPPIAVAPPAEAAIVEPPPVLAAVPPPLPISLPIAAAAPPPVLAAVPTAPGAMPPAPRPTVVAVPPVLPVATKVVAAPRAPAEPAAVPPPVAPPAVVVPAAPAPVAVLPTLSPTAVPEPKPAAIDWAALASTARPAPQAVRETEIAAFAVAQPAPVPTEFSLLDAIGQIPEPSPAPPPPALGGTLARLRSQLAGSAEPPLPSPSFQAVPTGLSSAPATGASAGEGIVPASAVTVPLGEVMRLIAAGNPPAASPIDTFRAALRSSSSF